MIEPLTREEQVILLGAQPATLARHVDAMANLIDEGVIWRGILFLSDRNKAGGLLHRYMKNLPAGLIPVQVQSKLRQDYLANYQRNQAFQELGNSIQDCLDRTGIPCAFLRGFVLAEIVYGNPALRRYSDIDILVTRSSVPAAIEALSAIGAEPRNGALSDSYYLRHHFHVERRLGGVRGATLELHWNLDHRYTLYTIDVEGLMRRARREPAGTDTYSILSPEDRYIGLCLHAVKHCPAIAYHPGSPLLARRVLLDGWLTQVVDLAMALEKCPKLRWEVVAETARGWGVEHAVYAATVGVTTILGICAPNEVTRMFSPRRSMSRVEAALTRRFLDPGHTLQPGRQIGRLERWILSRWSLQEDAVFHPVRLLDLVNFFFPDRIDLQRYMGRPRLRPYAVWWARHFVAGFITLISGGVSLLIHRVRNCFRGIVRKT